MSYEQKYLKYKQKYIELKNRIEALRHQSGGGIIDEKSRFYDEWSSPTNPNSLNRREFISYIENFYIVELAEKETEFESSSAEDYPIKTENDILKETEIICQMPLPIEYFKFIFGKLKKN